MKFLLDECVPKTLKKRLPNFDIKTVQEMGWSGVKNGELIKLAENEFNVFVTSDKNLKYQQNLENRKIAFVILPSNQIPIIENLIPKIEIIFNTIGQTDFVEVEI